MRFKVEVTVTIPGVEVEADSPDEALDEAVLSVEKLVGKAVVLSHYHVASDEDISDPNGPRMNTFVGKFSI